MADQQTPSTANPIRVVLTDTAGNIIGSLPVTIADNGDFALGAVADAAWVSGNGTAIAILKKIANGGGGGSGPVTVIDGGDVAEGATTDAAVTTDANGTVSGKLRGVVKLLAGGIAVSWAAAQHVVTDATSVTNATLSAETTKVIGTVNIASGQAIQANAGTNLNTSALALDATLVSSNTKLDTVHSDLGLLAKLTDTQPVSVASLPLPSGAALDSSLTTLDTDLKQLVTNAAPLPWFMAGQGTFFATGS